MFCVQQGIYYNKKCSYFTLLKQRESSWRITFFQELDFIAVLNAIMEIGKLIVVSALFR